MSNIRRSMMMAGRDSAIDWQSLYYGLCDQTISGEALLPSGITSIRYGLFYGCGGLTSVNIPNTVTTIAQSAFSNCRGLATVDIPDSVKTISSSAFYGCTGLTSMTIGNSVTSIGTSAFYSCNSLSYIIINATTPPTLSNANAFSSTNNYPIYVPNSSVAAYKAANNWSNLASRIFPISDMP